MTARGSSRPLVTVAVPVYKNRRYLPGALASVAAQDYPEIDLLISNNGMDPDLLQEVIDRSCPRPHRLRRNPDTVPLSAHFNQLVEAARGDYFVLLCDDDEISPDYVYRLCDRLEGRGEAGAALARLDVIDEAGRRVESKRDGGSLPAFLPDLDFVRAWCLAEHDFVCFATNMARTDEIRAVGGYPTLPKGTSIDNGLLLKLCVGRGIAFDDEARFRYRVYEASHGLALPYKELARDLKGFLAFLDEDPTLADFARRHPGRWKQMREWLIQMTWRTYRYRWKTMYRDRLSGPEWVRAAFAMPFIPAYYRYVGTTLLRTGLSRSKRFLLGRGPRRKATRA